MYDYIRKRLFDVIFGGQSILNWHTEILNSLMSSCLVPVHAPNSKLNVIHAKSISPIWEIFSFNLNFIQVQILVSLALEIIHGWYILDIAYLTCVPGIFSVSDSLKPNSCLVINMSEVISNKSDASLLIKMQLVYNYHVLCFMYYLSLESLRSIIMLFKAFKTWSSTSGQSITINISKHTIYINTKS